MKRLILLVVALMVVFSFSVLAVDKFSTDNFEFVGGITFNDFTVEDSHKYGELEDVDEFPLASGKGFYIGGLYWLNDNFAVTAGYDYVNGKEHYKIGNYDPSWKEENEEYKLSGPYVGAAYKVNEWLKLNGALAFYNFERAQDEEDSDGNSDEETIIEAGGTGYLIGAQMELPVKDNFALTSDVTYRIVNLEADKFQEEDLDPDESVEYNLKGFRVSIGLAYKF